jgi:hypothetical protein
MTQMQNKYTFTQEFTDEDGQTEKIEHTFYSDFHTEIADRFNEFLRGCGYVFHEGQSYGLVTDPELEEHWTTTDLGDAVLNEFDEKSYEQELWEQSVANVPTQNYPTGSWPFAPVTKCPKCGITSATMGGHACYEPTGCGLGLNGKLP